MVAHFRRHASNTASTAFTPSAIRLYEKHLRVIDEHKELARRQRRTFRGWSLFHLGNANYAQKRWLRPTWCYVRGAIACPALLVRHDFWLQLAKSLLPPSVRDRLQRHLRADQRGQGKAMMAGDER
jgi:hypothetical protein